jgi:hypothetical protein
MSMDELDDILDKVSFSRLVNRLHARTEQDLAMKKWVKGKQDVVSWQSKLRAKLAELLGIDDLIGDRGSPASPSNTCTFVRGWTPGSLPTC